VRSARGAPVDTPATSDAFFLLSESRALRLPTPPQQRNEGNFVISLSQLTRCAPARGGLRCGGAKALQADHAVHAL
jgi:hypothetical protein